MKLFCSFETIDIGPDECRALNESLPSLVQLQTLDLSSNNLLFFF